MDVACWYLIYDVHPAACREEREEMEGGGVRIQGGGGGGEGGRVIYFLFTINEC